jgi:hypothetical protein
MRTGFIGSKLAEIIEYYLGSTDRMPKAQISFYEVWDRS